MGKRMNDKLTEYRQKEMYDEYIPQDESNRNCNYDMYDVAQEIGIDFKFCPIYIVLGWNHKNAYKQNVNIQ